MRFLLAIAILALAVYLLREPLSVHGKVLLLLSEQLPQIPIKPISALTPAPTREQARFNSRQGEVVADVLTPAGGGTDARYPAVVLALGIPLLERDRPNILGVAETFARLGYVTVWPRSAALDAIQWRLEEPEVFVSTVEWLGTRERVDSERISFFGISIGSSLAMVAAADPRIADRVENLIAFGAYHDLGEYLTSLVSRSAQLDGRTVPWVPHEWALEQARDVLTGIGQPEAARLIDAAPARTDGTLQTLIAARLPSLDRFNPARHLEAYRARTFILHDRNDGFVPYVESERLRRALPGRQIGGFLLSDLFQHANVKAEFGLETLREMAALYRFAAAVMSEL